MGPDPRALRGKTFCQPPESCIRHGGYLPMSGPHGQLEGTWGLLPWLKGGLEGSPKHPSAHLALNYNKSWHCVSFLSLSLPALSLGLSQLLDPAGTHRQRASGRDREQGKGHLWVMCRPLGTTGCRSCTVGIRDRATDTSPAVTGTQGQLTREMAHMQRWKSLWAAGRQPCPQSSWRCDCLSAWGRGGAGAGAQPCSDSRGCN